MRLQRAVVEELPPEAAKSGAVAVRHLSALYDAVDAHVAARHKEFQTFPDQPTKEGAITEMRNLVRSVRKLQKTLAWVDAISEPPLDLGTKYFVELAARRLVDPKANLVLVCAGDASYSTFSNPYAQLIADWGDPSTTSADTVIIVFLPRRERQSALLHPLIVHELGHAVCKAHGLRGQVRDAALKRKRLLSRFSKSVGAVVERDQKLPQEAVLEISARMNYWIEEVICDSIACQYLGPTYLYSFVTEVLAGNLDQPGPKHPPPRLRISLMLEQLDELGWTETMKEHGPGLDQWLRDLGAKVPAYEHEVEFLVWVLNTINNDLRKRVARRVDPHTFSPDKQALVEIMEFLAAGIPSAQRYSGETVDPRAVALGCWCYVLRACGGDIASVPGAADAEDLPDLLPKGLELAALLEAWS